MSWGNVKIIGHDQQRGEAGQKRGDKDFVMSRSQLVAFAECPAKWIAGGEVEEETKAMSFGSILDCLATSPETFEKRFAVTPELYPVIPKSKSAEIEMKPWTVRANYCSQWEADKRAEGFTVVSPEMLTEAKLAFSRLHENQIINSLIGCSKKQILITAEWVENKIAIPFSALLDLVPDKTSPTFGKMLVDIKTTRNGNPANWARTCEDRGYDVQAAIYFDLYKSARPDEDRTDFVHVVQENLSPFHVVTPLMAMSEEFLNWGRQKYQKALRQYAQCIQYNHWPSYEQVGIKFGHTQIISPDDLWSYRNCKGMTEFKEPQPEQTPTPGIDIVP